MSKKVKVIMFNPKVSVIVPVYNVSQYLEKCLNSITSQTLKEIEIIIINDCSPDPVDDQICLKFAARDSRIIYLTHDDNKGLSAARNTGIYQAKADYIGFIDSDDYIHPKLFEIAYKEAVKDSNDIVVFGYNMVGENYDYLSQHMFDGDTNGDLFKKYLEYNNSMCPTVWNKLWKKSLFIDNSIEFPIGLGHEDEMTTPRLIYFAKNIKYIDHVFYYYLQREGSFMHTYSKKHFDDIFDALSLLTNFVSDFGELDKYKESLQIRFWGMIRYKLRTISAFSTISERNNILTYIGDRSVKEKVPYAHYYFPHRYY